MKKPPAAGDRLKTDRRDAALLVRLLLAGALTAVSVSPPAFEAARTARGRLETAFQPFSSDLDQPPGRWL
jgi:hypothetical protein